MVLDDGCVKYELDSASLRLFEHQVNRAISLAILQSQQRLLRDLFSQLRAAWAPTDLLSYFFSNFHL